MICTLTLTFFRQEGMTKMMQTREEKIRSFKEKKELDAKVKELHEKMKQDYVDDEIKVTLIRFTVYIYSLVILKMPAYLKDKLHPTYVIMLFKH